MTEPVTLFCVKTHEYGSRTFVPGDVVTITAPSVARDFVASGYWSYDPPDDEQVTPEPEPQIPPAKPRGRKRGAS